MQKTHKFRVTFLAGEDTNNMKKFTRVLDFVINTLSAIRDITYDIAKESIKSPQNEPLKPHKRSI